MLTSANYTREENVMRPGEHVAPEHDVKKPGYKVYYNRIKGSITHLPDGTQITFQGGQFGTANDEIKAFLDKIADKQGSQIYTKQEVGEALVVEAAVMAEGAALPASAAATAGARPTVETVAAVRNNVPTARAAASRPSK